MLDLGPHYFSRSALYAKLPTSCRVQQKCHLLSESLCNTIFLDLTLPVTELFPTSTPPVLHLALVWPFLLHVVPDGSEAYPGPQPAPGGWATESQAPRKPVKTLSTGLTATPQSFIPVA